MVMKDGKPATALDFGVKASPSTQDVPTFLAVDPGDEHVGVAEFARLDGVWYCIWAHEFNPVTFKQFLAEGLRKRRWVKLVVESWRLFPQAAPMYVGSDMPTSKLIGAIEFAVEYVPVDSGWFDEEVELVLQDPMIKVPTRGLLKRRKLRSVAKILHVALDHASDAELHGYKYLFGQHAPVQNSNQQAEHWRHVRDLSGSHALW